MEVLEQFKKRKYLNLETYRKNGEGVRTPVWFVEYENSLFVITMSDSWKVKRIRKERKVKVAACRMNGQVIGHWESAFAQEIHDQALEVAVKQLYSKKYGLMNAIFERQRVKTGNQKTILKIGFEE